MPKASDGYGGKFGVQKDRMDKVYFITHYIFLLYYFYFYYMKFFFVLKLRSIYFKYI